MDGDPDFANLANGDYHVDSGSEAVDSGIDVGVMTDRDGFRCDVM